MDRESCSELEPMQTKDFYYHLPEELIAQTPAEPRDSSRMMVYDRKTGRAAHKIFRDITEYLRPADVLVLNQTRVIPARLLGTKKSGTASVECLLLKPAGQDVWEVLLRPGKRLHEGNHVVFGPGLEAEVLRKDKEGVAVVRFSYTEGTFEDRLEEYGSTPLPPYIHKTMPSDKSRYQTVYAKVNGSVAAPTAGLHFTNALLEAIRKKGIDIVPILLHVGLGTFRPVKVQDITRHVMHSEYYSVSPEAAARINAARTAGGRVVAVGTTSVRTLESAAGEGGRLLPGCGETDIFIYPGYTFKCVDALITNFHLPESTLIMLVSALIGREETLRLYDLAVRERYRFFSYGDAMAIF